MPPTSTNPVSKKIRFYLKRKEDAKTPLICLFSHDGKRTKIYTSLTVETRYWDSGEQKVKLRNNPTGSATNAELQRITDVLTDFYTTCRAKGVEPTDEALRACIAPVAAVPSKQPDKPPINFWSHWEAYFKKVAETEAMKAKLKVVGKRLCEFDALHPLHIDSITDVTLEDFYDYLTEQGLQKGTASRHTKFVKSFLSWCAKKGRTTNTDWQKYDAPAPPDALKIVLNKAEMDALRNTPLPAHLANVRDFFLIECLTGLRFSDCQRIAPEHIKDGFLAITQEKTGTPVRIPLSAESAKLIDKLITSGDRPGYRQTLRSLKEVARLCGIDEPFEVIEFRGKVRTSHTKPKWELIGHHTARRSFATNAVLDGKPASMVMRYTGHKDLACFLRYVNIPPESQDEVMRASISRM